MRAVLTISGALLIACAISRTTRAADEIPADDLQAVAHSLGFLDSIPHDGTIFVGIVYSSAVPGSKVMAVQTAERFNGVAGPKSAIFRSLAVDADDLLHMADRLDAIFLMPGIAAASGTVNNAIRQRHLVSISNDPACLDAKCCVLMVRAGQRLEIVLDTGLADAVGAHFSTVFMMMVKRK
jgi:hypothetical protein